MSQFQTVSSSETVGTKPVVVVVVATVVVVTWSQARKGRVIKSSPCIHAIAGDDDCDDCAEKVGASAIVATAKTSTKPNKKLLPLPILINATDVAVYNIHPNCRCGCGTVAVVVVVVIVVIVMRHHSAQQRACTH